MNRAWRCLASGLLALSLSAQESSDDSTITFRAETELAEIEVRVVGKGGKAILDLEKEDFVLKEDGRRQAIATFEFVGASQGFATEKVAPSQAPRSEADKRPDASLVRSDSRPLRVYVVAEATPGDQRFVYDAIRTYLDGRWTAGTLVSLGDRPFTADRLELRATLEATLAAPFGHDDQAGRWVSGLIDRSSIEIARLETERRATVREAVEATLSGDQDPRDAGPPGANTQQRLNAAGGAANTNANHPNIEMRPPRLRNIDQQLETLNRRALLDYQGLIRRLAAYPGKKVVVLFRGGLRVDQNNTYLSQHLAAEALRSRVSFYTVNSRGLETMSLTASESIDGTRLLGADPNREGLMTEYRTRRQTDQLGLLSLAELTGGKAVLNSNRMADVFDRVREDSSNYYLLGYYPATKRKSGRFHRVSVVVDRPGVKAYTGRGYYEPKPFGEMSKSEKVLHLERLIHRTTAARDYPVRIGYDFFRGDEERTLMLFGVSLPMKELLAHSQKKGDLMKFAVAVHAVDLDRGSSWTYRSPSYEYAFGREGLAKQGMGAATFLDYTEQISLPPGRYDWKVVLLDERDGRFGAAEESITVPDFTLPARMSSLLVASQGEAAAPVAAKGQKREDAASLDRVLRFRNNSFVPEFRGEFQQDQPIFFLYDLYNVSAKDLSAPPPIRMVLKQGDQVIEAFEASGDVLADSSLRRIRYLVGLPTVQLRPGSYSISAYYPVPQEEAVRSVTEQFTLRAR